MSLQKQTLRDVCIILVDDGSTDGSGALCDKIAAKDDRIRVIHKENGGSDSARFAGIKAICDGEYTTFCDADDYIPKDGVEKLYALAIEENAEVVSGTLRRFAKNVIYMKRCIPNSLKVRRTYNKEQIMNGIIPSYFGVTDFPGYLHTKLYSNLLIKKSVEFQRPVKFFQEDIAFNLQILFGTNRLAVMPDVVYCYRMGGGTSRFMPSFLEDCVALYKFKMEQIKKNNLPESLRYTTAIELKNELWTWFEMYYCQYEKKYTKQQIGTEIERACKLESIVEAVNYPKEDFSGMQGFRELVKEKNIEGIYELLENNKRKHRVKKMLKRILLG